MRSEPRAHANDSAKDRRTHEWRPKIGLRLTVVLSLVGNRQRLTFLGLVGERVLVGFCDLLLAGGTYVLFLLLQGTVPAHHRWWTPMTTLSAAVVTAALALIRVCLDVLSTRSVVGHVQELSNDFLLRLSDAYNHMRWVRIAQRNRSEMLNHSMNTVREAANFYHLGVEMMAGAIVMVGMAIALIYQSPAAACGLGITGGLLYGVHRWLIRGRLQRSASEREEAQRILQRSLADMFLSGKEMRSYGIQTFFQKRIAAQARVAAASFRRVALLPQIARIVTDQGALLVFLCVVIGVQLHRGDVRRLLSLLVFYFVLSRRLLPLISQISFMAGQMEGSYKSVELIASELHECSMHRTPRAVVQTMDGEIVAELEQVSFAFEEGKPLLRSVSLNLRQGETVLLRGISGSGKSSLLNVLAGILQPTSGIVRIDRAKTAYVPQDIVLLDDSIRHNLIFGRVARSDAELMQALAAADMAEVVGALPRGLDTEVGDDGILFSGGQRQRLGLARAMVGGARLLLLDEATSALDVASEAKVLANLHASGIAVLLVTHRTSSGRFAQRVLRLEQCCLTEETIEAQAGLQIEENVIAI